MISPLSDQELEALLDDLESDRTERKEAWAGSASEKVREAVCAFANDLPGHGLPGIVFIGAKDNGQPAGITVEDRLLQTLADIKTDGKIVPPPSLTVQKRVLKGAEMAIVTVLPAEAPPVRLEGRIWIRIGPSRRKASAQDESILNERRRHRDLPFDVHPLPSCGITELNRTLFEGEYLANAFAPDVLEANERTIEQRLAACRMITTVDSPTPTVLGILVLGNSPRSWLPGAYIQFLRIKGTQWGDPIVDEEHIDGPLSQMLHRLDDKLKAHVTTSVDFTSQATERRSSSYPLAALQQIARNAVMHRTYEHTNSPVRVHWFDDRIEVHSPGGPFGVVTRQNFGSPGVTDYRNPHIAEAMKVLGFVQKFGMGIATAQKALRENGNPPASFQVEDNFVTTTLPHGP